MAPRWQTADYPPVYGVPELPPADAGRPAVLSAHVPEDLQPPGGARAVVWDGPEQSESVDSRPLTGTAGRATHPRGCRSLAALAQQLGVAEADAATAVTAQAKESAAMAAAPAAPDSPLLPMTGPNGASSAPKM